MPAQVVAGPKARPRIVLAACDEAGFSDARLGELAEPVMLAQSDGKIWLVLEDGARTPLSDGLLHVPGAPLVGLVALSAQGSGMLHRMRLERDLAEVVGMPALLELDAGLPPAEAGRALAAWLNAQLLAELNMDARQLAGLHQELAELRIAYGEMTEQFAAVEAFVSEHASVPLLAFSNPADGGCRTRHYAELASNQVLTQLLPVKSTGLAAFELFIPPCDPETERNREFRVDLLTAEDDKLLASWEVKTPGDPPGWIGFVLPRGITGPARTPLVRVTATNGNDAPDLGLGRPNPVLRACVSGDGCATFERSLALKVWAGLPGIVPPRLIHTAPLLGEPPARQILLPKTCFADAKLASEPSAALSFDLVKVVNEGGELQIHPLEGRATVARLPHVLPAQAGYAFAEMRCGHSEAPDMEVAAMCGASSRQLEAWLAQEGPAVGFSGWMRLEKQATLRFGFKLEAAVAARDLHIAVRLAPGFSSAYAWARLVRLGFEPA